MTDSSLQIGKILGIYVRVNWAWIIIFVIFTLMMAEYAAKEFPTWTTPQHFGWGGVASLLFFTSVLLHELGHSVVAQAAGIRVHSITLHLFGGMARLAREAANPAEEFWIALAGPAVNIMIGLAMLILSLSTGTVSGSSKAFTFMMQEIGFINLFLGLFNLLPGFPLDGGRVLRAVLWWLNKDYRKATLIASRVGQVIAGLIAMIGFVLILDKRTAGVLWVIMGRYLFQAARTGYQQAELRETLRRITVSELCWEEFPQVPGDLSIPEFLAQYDFGGRDRSFLVMDGLMIVGIISLADARQAHANDTLTTPTASSLRDMMQPIERFERISPQTDLVSVVEKMEFAGVTHLPVVSNNEFQGFIGRDAVMDVIRERLDHET